MAGIQNLGAASGLPLDSILTQLVNVEKTPLTALTTQAKLFTAQLSEYGTIKSQMSALDDAAIGLGTGALWNPQTITSSNATAVTATANGVPSQTSYDLTVSQLARGQSVASDVYATGTTMGTGTLTLQLGTWNTGMSAFTPGSADAVTISIGTGQDSLTSIASKINDANAGVKATIITDSTGQRLSLRSTTTGAAAGFRMQVTDSDSVNNDNSGLSRVAFDPANGAFGMASTTAATVQAQDAKATLNGVAVTSSSNTFTGLVPGLNFQVGQVTTTPVTVTVSQDVATIKKTITDFVAAFNTLNTTFKNDTSYDSTHKAAALFQGDSTTVGLQNAMHSLLGSSTTGGKYSRLSDIGITLQKDGSLAIGTKLDTALQDVASVKQFFTANNGNTNTNGFGLKFKTFTNGLLATGGTMDAKNAAINKAIDANTKQQAAVNAKADNLKVLLTARYSALDKQVGSLQALGNYVTQQVTQWNKSTS